MLQKLLSFLYKQLLQPLKQQLMVLNKLWRVSRQPLLLDYELLMLSLIWVSMDLLASERSASVLTLMLPLVDHSLAQCLLELLRQLSLLTSTCMTSHQWQSSSLIILEMPFLQCSKQTLTMSNDTPFETFFHIETIRQL